MFDPTSHHLWQARVQVYPAPFVTDGLGTVTNLVVHNDNRVVGVEVTLDKPRGQAGNPSTVVTLMLRDLPLRGRVLV